MKNLTIAIFLAISLAACSSTDAARAQMEQTSHRPMASITMSWWADRAQMEQASHRAASAPIGQQVSWRNPDSGNSGTITPTGEGISLAGEYCREYQQTFTIAGKTDQAYANACRQPDGSWIYVYR